MPKVITMAKFFNPFTPMSDQDRISPHSVNTISTRQVMRIEKILNSLNEHFKNCMVGSKENYKFDQEVKGL